MPGPVNVAATVGVSVAPPSCCGVSVGRIGAGVSDGPPGVSVGGIVPSCVGVTKPPGVSVSVATGVKVSVGGGRVSVGVSVTSGTRVMVGGGSVSDGVALGRTGVTVGTRTVAVGD